MIDLPQARELTPEQSLALRQRLTTTIVADPLPERRPSRRRTRPLVVGALLVCLLIVAGLAAAVAITVTAAAPSGTDTAVVVDTDVLDVLYRGHRIPQEEARALTRDGLGTFTVSDVDTEHDLHATRAFDTLDELDAYSAAYLAWQRAKADGADVSPWGVVRP